MPAMPGTIGRRKCRNSDNWKPRAWIMHWNTSGTCGNGCGTYKNARFCMCFVLKCGQNMGFYGRKLGWWWGCKKIEQAPCFWLWHALCYACPFMYINRQMSIARGWGLADCSRQGEGAPGRFWPKADGFPRKIFYFFRIFPNPALFSCKYLIINNYHLSLKLRFSFRNWSLYIMYNIIGVLKIFCCAEWVKSHLWLMFFSLSQWIMLSFHGVCGIKLSIIFP